MDLKDLRIDYTQTELKVTDLNQNPIVEFRKWFQLAMDDGITYVNAMTLSTVDQNKYPQSRIVLLKEVKDTGFSFFTNYDSEKGSNLEKNPHVSLNFFWKEQERQIKILGTVTKLPLEESKNYFYSRPRESQVSAIISPQSQVIESKKVLEKSAIDLKSQFGTQPYPYPKNWGGYHVTPIQFEFWQGRPNRLHDRFRYKNENGKWFIETLAP